MACGGKPTDKGKCRFALVPVNTFRLKTLRVIRLHVQILIGRGKNQILATFSSYQLPNVRAVKNRPSQSRSLAHRPLLRVSCKSVSCKSVSCKSVSCKSSVSCSQGPFAFGRLSGLTTLINVMKATPIGGSASVCKKQPQEQELCTCARLQGNKGIRSVRGTCARCKGGTYYFFLSSSEVLYIHRLWYCSW